jgi:hypothetical protein
LSGRGFFLIVAAIAGCGRVAFDPLATRDGGDGDDSAGDPDAAISACNNYVVAHVDSFSTGSKTFVDVPGGSIDLPPTDDEWLLFASAGLRSPSTAQQPFEVILLVDGLEHTRNQNTNAQDKAMPWLFAGLAGVNQTNVRVQVRDLDIGGTIENLQLVAWRIPAGIESTMALAQLPQTVGTTFTPVLTEQIDPPTTGGYLVLASATASESPGTNNVELQLVDHTGASWPMVSNAGAMFTNNRTTWRSAVWARVVDLTPGVKTFTIEAMAATTSATVRNLRIMIFRADQIGAGAIVFTAPTTAPSSAPVTMGIMNMVTPATPTDVVTFQALTVAGGTDATGTNPMVVDFLRGGVSRAHYENYETTGAPVFPYGYTDAFTHSGPPTSIANQFSVADPSRVVIGKESALIAFKRSCP